MMRITTNGTLRSYKSNLLRSSTNLNSAREMVLTQRNFTSYAEDPAAATKAFQLRRSYSRVSDQKTNVQSLISKFESAEAAISTVKSDLVEKYGMASALAGVNDATASGRQALGQVLSSSAESIVQSMNVQYGDTFIFAGSDGLNVPFSWSSSGKLQYRGVNVDTTDSSELASLTAMAEESVYSDVGAGLTEDENGTINSASAFNSAISGIDILGYGVDDDGDPKNVASIMKQLGEIFSRCDADSGDYASDEDAEDAERLTEKLNGATSSYVNKWTELDGKATYLNTTKEQLTTTAKSLNEQILSIEQVKMADAITEFSWAQYCYNAALKVGNSILSQSLIDYMN